MRLLTAIKSDLIFQYRSGLHTIYVVLTLIYILSINQLPDNLKGLFAALMIFSDPSVLGFFFIGGLVMLEKSQGVMEMLTVTPLRVKEYLLSKVMTLAFISIASGFSIAYFTKQSFNPYILILAIVLNANLYTLIGLWSTFRSNTVNQYFGKVIPLMVFITLPCFTLIWSKYRMWFGLFPSVSGLKLIIGGFSTIGIYENAFYVLSMLFWNLYMYHIVASKFENQIIEGGVIND